MTTLLMLTLEGSILSMELPSLGSALLYGEIMVGSNQILAADAFQNGQYQKPPTKAHP